MPVIRSFRDLDVDRMGSEQSQVIFRETKLFPREEMYSLTDQIRRSSRAVNAMIAEAWARRRYPAAFVNKINEALGEAMETQAWLDHALGCEYMMAARHAELDAKWNHIGAMLNRVIETADSFCKAADPQPRKK